MEVPMKKNNSKCKVIFWIISYIVSYACIHVSSLSIFLLPISFDLMVVCITIYLLVVFMLSVCSFSKEHKKLNSVLRKLLLVVLGVPVVISLIIVFGTFYGFFTFS